MTPESFSRRECWWGSQEGSELGLQQHHHFFSQFLLGALRNMFGPIPSPGCLVHNVDRNPSPSPNEKQQILSQSLNLKNCCTTLHMCRHASEEGALVSLGTLFTVRNYIYECLIEKHTVHMY